MNKKMGGLDYRKIWSGFAQCLIASVLMGGVLWVFLHFYHLDLSAAGFGQKVAEIILLLLVGAGSYLLAARLLKISELEQIFKALLRSKK